MGIQNTNSKIENAKHDSTLANRDERRRRQHSRMKVEILESALKVFAKKGFSGTTMNDIARAAGFGTGSLYTYFKTKEDILVEVIKQTFGLMELVYTDSVSATIPSFRNRVLDLMRRKISFVVSNGVLPQLIQSGVIPAAVPADSHFEKNSPPQVIRNLMATWFEKFSSSEERSGRTPNECAYFLSSLLRSIVEALVFEQQKFVSEEDLENLIQTTLQFFLSGLANLNGRGEKS